MKKRIKMVIATVIALVVSIHFMNDFLDAKEAEEKQRRQEAIQQAADTYAPLYNDIDKVFVLNEEDVALDDNPVVAEGEKIQTENNNEFWETVKYAFAKDQGGIETFNEAARYVIKKCTEELIPGWASWVWRLIRKI